MQLKVWRYLLLPKLEKTKQKHIHILWPRLVPGAPSCKMEIVQVEISQATPWKTFHPVVHHYLLSGYIEKDS